jgi:acyl-homoserine lactone acylase PvdQ
MEQKTRCRFVCTRRLTLVSLFVFLVALVAGAAAWAYRRTHVCLAQLDGTVRVPRLRARVEVQRGVNAFISTSQRRLPFEFLMLRYRARPWQENDSFAVALIVANTLNTSWPEELVRVQILKLSGSGKRHDPPTYSRALEPALNCPETEDLADGGH